jgi:hypothetical protein
MAMSARPLLAALLLPALLLSAASAADSKSTAPAVTPSIPHGVALRAAATLLVFMLACGSSPIREPGLVFGSGCFGCVVHGMGSQGGVGGGETMC